MQEILKSESTPKTPVPSQREQGQPQHSGRIFNYLQDLKQQELAMPRRLFTYDDMAQDEAIKQPLELTQTLTLLGISNGSWESTGSTTSQAAADKLNYFIHNMTYGTWFEAAVNMVSSIKYGFAFLNIVLEKRTHGEYAGSMCIKKLAPRSQKGLYGWIYDDKEREVLGILQKPQNLRNSNGIGNYQGLTSRASLGAHSNKDLTPIYNRNLLRFTHNSVNNNPQGNSALNACFDPYTEKKVIEQYEIIGISKDFGGLVVVRVNEELMRKALNPTDNPEDAAAYFNLENQVANIHAGKQSYIMLSDEMCGDGKTFSYDIKLLGIEGGGKQYNTSDIVDQKRKAIYNCFGAGYLLLGQDSHGSYNLSSTGRLTHSFQVEKNTAEIVSVIDSDLTTKLLAANDIYLSHKDMPKFVPANPDQLSFDDGGKFIQRAKSVGALTETAAKHVYKLMGIPFDGLENIDFTSKDSSRAGESRGTSGIGNSQDGSANSATNVENTGITKSLVIDKSFETDTQVVAVDRVTGDHYFIDKEE